MKSSRRLFIGFGIAIGVLVIVTIALVLSTRGGSVSLLPEDTPQGTVQRFLIVVQDRDFPKAYAYLKVEERGIILSYSDWVRNIPPAFQSSPSAWKATLAATTVTGNQASVEVVVDVFRPGGPFEDPVRSQTVSFQLTKIGGTWFITTRPPLYWLY